jgi:hypothetical protein
MSKNRGVVSIASVFLAGVAIAWVFLRLPAALAQGQCPPGQGGTLNCPTYTAPATTSAPHPAIGGRITINGGSPATVLFGGVTPPNGFMVGLNFPGSGTAICNVTDTGLAVEDGENPSGFMFGSPFNNPPGIPLMFVTPPGYKPMGPVSVMCSGSVYAEVRAW